MSLKNIPITKTRVAIYIRVSTLHQIDKDSLPMQRQDLIAYTKLMLNTDDYVIFEDAGYSGKNTDRPEFQKMMSQIRQGLFTHILVWKIDRISRNLLDFAMMYNELKELGIIFVSKNEQFDTSSAMGEAMLKIILVFAELERNMTAERVTATMISRANNGQWNGGRVPYGYNYNSETAQFHFDPTEAPIIVMIHDLYEQECSLVREARILNSRGYRTRSGNQWSPVSLLIILRSTFYCGDYQYNVLKEGNRQKMKDKSEWILIQNHHPALITREQKEHIISILNSNSRLRKSRNLHQSGKHTHIFASLLYCGNCGKPMGASPAAAKKDWQYSKYSCYTQRKVATTCNGKSTSDPIIGEFVFNYILNMLNAQNKIPEIHSPKELQKRLLYGDTFRYIQCIKSDGLNDLYKILLSGNLKKEVYGKNTKIQTTISVKSQIAKLRIEKQRLELALDKLTNLYLYSDNAISEKEYIIQKTKLQEAFDDINEQIGFVSSDSWQQSISDEIFIQRASEFILTQKLTDRNYINYKRLAMSVDSKVLKSFILSIIDSITMYNGKVQKIVFKNGLSHSFVFKEV